MTYADFFAFFGLALVLDFCIIVVLTGIRRLLPSQQSRFFWAKP